MQRMLAEVQALYPIVEFAFMATGCHMAFDQPQSVSLDSTGRGGAGSPIRSKTAALKMYNESAAMRMEVQSGVNATSLVDFVGIIENHAADLIQQYAAVVTTGGFGSSMGANGNPSMDMTRRFLSPAALGPSRPSGKLKESVTTSALMAALGGEPGKPDGSVAEDGTGDDDARPMTVAELKRQAAAQVGGDKTMKLMRASATHAANVLTRVGVAAQPL
jgi:hypothetical protein